MACCSSCALAEMATILNSLLPPCRPTLPARPSMPLPPSPSCLCTHKTQTNWIQVRGAGADIFFRDPYVLDENLSVELSSPSSSRYKTVEDLGPPQEAAKKVLKQYLTEFMSTRLGVRRESNVLSTSSRVADDGKLYYQVEVNIKSYANTNELAVMPQDRVPRLEWNRRYLSVLGVENNRLYELRLQTPESVFVEEESDLRQVMDSFRVNKVAG
ncbi:hypothetical protein DITRI_Ditri20bG0004000 [Diplodiscus trichospermus]